MDCQGDRLEPGRFAFGSRPDLLILALPEAPYYRSAGCFAYGAPMQPQRLEIVYTYLLGIPA